MDARLSFLLENSNDIFCVFDIKGNVVKTNASFGYFTGYSEEEVKGKSFDDLLGVEGNGKRVELFKALALQKNISGYLTTVKSKQGDLLNITWSLSFNDTDQLIYAIGIYDNRNLNIQSPYNISDKIQHVLANLTEGFIMLDKNWRISAFNPAFREIVNVVDSELQGADFRLLNTLVIANEVIPVLGKTFEGNTPHQLQYYDTYYKGWLRLNIYPYKGELIIFMRNISSMKIQQSILALEKKVLELNLLPYYTLSQVADELLSGIEEIFPEMYCSILEVDAAQKRVYTLSAPRLPNEYSKAINGTEIGPKAGSCGAAAYLKEQVIVKDIEHSPLWDHYRQYIMPYGFKACWSTPVMSSQGNKVLATFAIYYDAIREPKTSELQMIERTINILRVLIESRRNAEHLADQNMRLQDIASISSHDIRRPVATILGLVDLFDRNNPTNPLNKEIIEHLETASLELDDVIHIIVEKTINI